MTKIQDTNHKQNSNINKQFVNIYSLLFGYW
jgi:hypothetical protein